jgi:trigger factor
MKRIEDAPEAQGGRAIRSSIDFVGSVDGVAFDGGTGEAMSVEIGTGRLIPGFEDQLVGVKVGDEKQIEVTFPEDYVADTQAGKPANSTVTITTVKTAGETKIDDDFAKNRSASRASTSCAASSRISSSTRPAV